jgi:hypothetical protein
VSPALVVAHGGLGIGVAGCVPNIPPGHAGVEGCGDERVAQAVRADALGDPCPAGRGA